jgi:HSP20 family protein
MNTQMHQVWGPLADLYESPEWPLMAPRPGPGHPGYHHGDQYVLRVEIPGINSEEDISLTAADGVLTIEAQRDKDGEPRHYSESQYGQLTRSFALPTNADESRIMAIYSHGILEISVELENSPAEHARQHIPVKVDRHIKPA